MLDPIGRGVCLLVLMSAGLMLNCINSIDFFFFLKNEELDKKYAGLLEKKWTSVIRLQKKVCNYTLT